MSAQETKGRLLILHGFDKVFAHAIIKPGFSASMDLQTLRELFEGRGYEVEICGFAELDLTRDLSGYHVLYASSEWRGLFYKDYIEDVILGARLAGATLLPDFSYFRAHHNKSFGEMVRNRFRSPLLKTIASRSFGTFWELQEAVPELSFPCIVKSSAGCGSSGVKLAKSPEELLRIARKLSHIIYFDFWFNTVRGNPLWVAALNAAKRLSGRQPIPYRPLLANKLVVQNYVEELDGDYKVLVFHDRYFVLHRHNRKNGFTASGSGRSEFPTDLSAITEVLDFASLAHGELNCPVTSLDIGKNRRGFHLLEFQCLFFGPYTLQRSPCYYQRVEGHWTQVTGASHLESEYARAVDLFITEREGSTKSPSLFPAGDQIAIPAGPYHEDTAAYSQLR